MVLVSCRAAAVRLSLFASIVGLAACGGGGGGGDSSGGSVTASGGLVAPASLTLTQGQMFAGRVANLVGQSAGATGVSEDLYVLATSTTASSGAEVCEQGGSVSFTRNDADRNNIVSAGDSISLTGANCGLLEGGATVTLDGRVEAQVLVASGGLYYQPGMVWNLRTRQTYSALAGTINGQTARIDGVVEVDDSQVGSTYRFANYVVSLASSQKAIQVISGDLFINTNVYTAGSTDPTRITAQFNNVVIQTNLSATEKVNLTVPAGAAPQLRFDATGQVIGGTLIVQLDKAKITVTVIAPNQVRVDVDNNNDGSIDATQTLTWAALRAAGAL